MVGLLPVIIINLAQEAKVVLLGLSPAGANKRDTEKHAAISNKFQRHLQATSFSHFDCMRTVPAAGELSS